MRTLTLKLTTAITGRRTKPPIPDAELAAIKERARALLNQPTTAADPGGWHDLHGAQLAAPTPPANPLVDDLGLKKTPRPTYDPARARYQATTRTDPFGSKPTGVLRPETPELSRKASGWDIAWAQLKPSEQAWSSQP